MNESCTSGLGISLEETICPVKCFYGNSVSRVQADASVNSFIRTSSPLCEMKAHLPEKVKTLDPLSSKRVPAKSALVEANLTVADRKLKTVERKHRSSVKVKNSFHNGPYNTRKELVFKRSVSEVAKSEKKQNTGESTLSSQNENSSQEGGSVKRFFKYRTSNHRKFVTSVSGRLVNLADLSNRSSVSPKHGEKCELSAAKTVKKEVGAALEKKFQQANAITSSQKCSMSESSCIALTQATNAGHGKAVFEITATADQKLNSPTMVDHKVLEYVNNNNSLYKTSAVAEPCTVVEHEKTKSPLSQVLSKSAPRQTVLFSPGTWARSDAVIGQKDKGTSLGLGDKRKSCDTPTKFSLKKDKKGQMILDFGQKLHGTENCSTCGMTYARNHPDDELLHSQHHRDMFRTLQFSNRTSARIAQDFQDGGFVVVITAEDRRLLKRVEEIKQIVDKELGYIVETSQSAFAKTFLYVLNSQVCGFCLAHPLSWANRMQNFGDPTKTQCCSEKAVPVRCAISRIWVLASGRRKGIASRLLDVVRSHFLMGYPLSTDEIAFSDPTPDGARFAAKYCQTGHFLVYSKTSN